MGSSLNDADAKIDEKLAHRGVYVKDEQIDVAAHLAVGDNADVDPAEAERVRKKIDWNILPLMCTLYWCVTGVGIGNYWLNRLIKGSIHGQDNIGKFRNPTDTHLNANDNWLGTIFYVSYLIFEYPQNLALQRLPVAKWLSINIFVWSIALAAHAACKNFGGLFAVRFILGMCEGSITAGFMIVTSMFYTHAEQSKRVGYWFLMNGTAQIIAGFLSFASLHIKKGPIHPWQLYMIITGLITFVVAVCFWFFFPDSPTTARFLTHEERRIAVLRIKANKTGVENKHFKMEQVIEALKDPKTWLFALFACLDNIPNSLTNQRQIIVNSFGFTTLQTTLLGCVDGVIEIITIWTGVTLAGRYPNARAYVSIIYFIPNILGSILVNVLPWKDKVGLLFAVWITGVGTTGFVLALGWVTAVTAGHTKRITVNAIVLGSYCVGNIVGPQMWQQKYKPRNHLPWIIIAVCYVICPFLLYVLRVILDTENKRRDAEAQTKSGESDEDAYIEETLEDGSKVERKVDKAFLDLTDIQNREFRYVL